MPGGQLSPSLMVALRFPCPGPLGCAAPRSGSDTIRANAERTSKRCIRAPSHGNGEICIASCGDGIASVIRSLRARQAKVRSPSRSPSVNRLPPTEKSHPQRQPSTDGKADVVPPCDVAEATRLCNLMVTHSSQSASVFAAISDPTRRTILDAVREGERSAGELAALFPVSRPAISRHLRVLRQAGLLRERKASRSRLYSLDPLPLREVDRWIGDYRLFWASRLSALARLAEARQESSRPPRSTPD